MIKKFLFLLVCLFLSSCYEDSQFEHYDLEQLVLTSESHPYGYGQENCFFCHVKENIHSISASEIELGTRENIEAARRGVEQQGVQSCSGCHGSNGN